MFGWYKKVLFQNYSNFRGRARRSEYWYFTLTNVIISTAILLIPMIIMIATQAATGGSSSTVDKSSPGYMISIIFGGIYMLYVLATIIPSIAVSVRRLHDLGKSGWSFLIIFVPAVGSIILLIWLLQDSQPGSNAYGPNPKGVEGNFYGQMNNGYQQNPYANNYGGQQQAQNSSTNQQWQNNVPPQPKDDYDAYRPKGN